METYVLISELRNYDLQTDVLLLVNLGYCAPVVLLVITEKFINAHFIHLHEPLCCLRFNRNTGLSLTTCGYFAILETSFALVM